MEIRDKSEAHNLVVDHLIRIERFVDDVSSIQDDFPDESLLTLSASFPSPWFANILNYLITS